MRKVYHPGIFLDTDQSLIYEIEIPTLPGKPYAEVMHIGDIHIGHRDFAPRFLAKYLSFLKDTPERRVVMMGDYFEHEEGTNFIHEQIMDFTTQVKEFVKFFTPVSKQIVSMVYGNHDERFSKQAGSGIDLLDFLRMKIGNPDIFIAPPQRGLIIIFKIKNINGGGNYFIYPEYTLHSSTGAIVNVESQFRRTADNFDVPIIAHGHTHKIFWKENTRFLVAEDEHGEFSRAVVRQYWLSTGCSLRFPSYGETKSMPVPDMGCPIIRLYADRHAVEYIDPRTTYGLDQEPFAENYEKELGEKLEDPQDKEKDEANGCDTVDSQELEEIKNIRCPECSGYKIGSKGTEWVCKSCGKRFMKNPRKEKKKV
jgi:predicted phosphodiesterase